MGSFGGLTGGKSGVKRDKEIPFKSEHVAVRTYRIVVDEDLKAGEYASSWAPGASHDVQQPRRLVGWERLRPIYDFTVTD